MKPRKVPWLVLIILIGFCVDLILKLADGTSFAGMSPSAIALALAIRFVFMGVLLYVFLRIRRAPSQPARTGTIESQFRAVRIMHRVLLAAVILYVLLAERMAKSTRSLPLSMTLSFGITAIAIVLVAFGYRMKMLSSAIEALRRNPQDAQALFRWRQAHILIMVLLLSVALLGFALRFIGGSFWVVLPFYFFSFALLLIWGPREVVATNGGIVSDSFGN